MKKLLILCASLFLVCLSGNCQSFIDRFYQGEVITVDTAVCMDLNTYRVIRNFNLSSDEALKSKIELIGVYESTIFKQDTVITRLMEDKQILQAANTRKDSVIENTIRSFDKIYDVSQKAVFMLENPKKQFFLTDKHFWEGIVGGFILGLVTYSAISNQ